MSDNTQYRGTRNYADQGGKRWVIGGTLKIKKGAVLEIDPEATAQHPCKYMGDLGADVTSIALARARINTLLANLRTAGLMAAAPTIVITAAGTTALTMLTTDAAGTVKLKATAAVSDGSTPSYQWYAATDNTGAGESAVNGATSDTYDVPANANAGILYYFCRASHEGVTEDSAVLTVTVSAPAEG